MLINKAIVASSIFLLVSMVYIIVGLYGIVLNPKSRINRLFFSLCVTLSIWSGCFAIVTQVDANDIHNSTYFYMKISVLGWGIFYPLMYHFFMVITDNRAISYNKLAIIYSPSVIAIIGFATLGDFSSKQFNMVFTEWGWTNLTPISFMNVFFIGYALFFSLLILSMIHKWSNQFDEYSEGGIYIRTKLMFVFYFASFIMGTFIDGIVNRWFHISTLQITCVILLLPVLFMAYILIKYNVIDSMPVDSTESIMNNNTRVNLFRMIGYVYIIFGYFTLYLHHISILHRMQNQIIVSVILIFVGLIHFRIHAVIVKPQSVYKFMTIMAMIMLNFVHFRYKNDGLIIMWAVFFFYILVTILFDDIRYMILITMVMIGFQIWTWIDMPRYYFYMDWSDYLGWIFLALTCVVAIYLIRGSYANKLKSVLAQIHMQKVLTELSAALLDITVDNVKEKAAEYLDFCNTNFGNKRTYYCYINEDTEEIKLAYYRDQDGVSAVGKEIIFDNIITCNDCKHKEMIALYNIEDIHNFDKSMEYYLKKYDILGFFALPVMHNNKVIGVLVFEFDNRDKSYVLYQYNKLLINMITDTVAKIRHEQELYYNANYDKISEVKNIDAFIKEVTRKIEYGDLQYASVFFMDIYHFKNINDAFGHNTGDKVLKVVADRIAETADENDVVARFGGDEFCVFYSNFSSKEEIEKKVKYLLFLFTQPIAIDNYEFRVNLNIGISIFPDDGEDINVLLKNADLAMNNSKKISSMRYHFCVQEDKDIILENAMYTNRLYNALGSNEFLIAYQPQIDCKTEKIVGAEALLRWHSPEFGILPPNKFISILERTGLIVEVGEWVIEQAVIEHLKILQKGLLPLKIAVNLSAIQFQDFHLLDTLKNILNKWGINPKYCELEITESAVGNDDDFVMDIFSEIKALGCSISIDDFGVEFSSLNRLQMLPLDKLKIDRSFITGVGFNHTKEAIVSNIISLGKALGLVVIAEGVEDDIERQIVMEHGCDQIQGYYYAKPMFEQDFVEYIKMHS